MPGKINTLAKTKKWPKKRLLILFVVIVLVIGTVAFIHHRSVHNKQVATRIPSKGPTVKKPSKKSAGSSSSVSSGTGDNAAGSDKAPAQTGTLTAPTGNFVSNHRPSLSGSSLLRQEKSVCNTTPGATCYIMFMKDGIVKELASQTVDSSGSTYWIWDVDQAGLTQGSWKVTAVATLNGQTLTTDDGLSLEVQP